MSEEEKPLRAVWMVRRIVRFHTADTACIPFGMYMDEKSAKAAASAAQSQLNELISMGLVGKRYHTPEGEMRMEPLVPLQEFLFALGVAQVGHSIQQHEVHSASGIVIAKPGVLLDQKH